MNIGIIVDGQAEYRSLPKLIPRIITDDTIISPIYADIQPLAPVPQIVGTIRRKIPILLSRNARKIIILIDRETRPECPGEWASQIESSLNQICAIVGVQSFKVVIKDKCFENWLVSDTTVFRKLPKRFGLRTKQQALIVPDKADQIDAQELIRSIVRNGAYNKVEDAIRIMERASPEIISSNSRSFRRFLRIIGAPAYRLQSQKPVV